MEQGRKEVGRRNHGVMGKNGDKFNVQHDSRDEKDPRNETLSKQKERDRWSW